MQTQIFDFLGERPWAHQKEAIARASSHNYFALFFEQGCGKSRTVIDILRDKFKLENRILKTLVLGPPIVVENWRNEWEKYSEVPRALIKTVQGSLWQRLSRTDDIKSPGIFITPYTSLYMKKLLDRFLDMKFDAIVLDESHKIKNFKAKLSKACWKLGDGAKYRYILSGTPVTQDAMDLFSQFRFLDNGETFGRNAYFYRQNYFVDFNAGKPKQFYFPNWVMRPTATQELNETIRPITMRVEKKDCLDLPPLVRQVINVELTDEQSRIYRELEKEMVADLSSGTKVVTDLVITRILRLQQLISGYVTDENGQDVEVENNRFTALQDVLESIGPKHKVIIWAVFKRNYEDIGKLLRNKVKWRKIVGAMANDAKTQAVKDFTTDPTVQVLVANPTSAGIGINLVEASYSIFFSRGYSLESDLQAEARNYRAGSERHEKVTRIDLVTPGTIDEVIQQALAKKQQLGEAILKHYKGAISCRPMTSL